MDDVLVAALVIHSAAFFANAAAVYAFFSSNDDGYEWYVFRKHD